MQDLPKATELLQAVAEFLRQQAMPALSGQTAFHARVAANVLDIVRRELELAPRQEAEERQRLGELLGEDADLESLNRSLCQRIDAGELDLDSPGLFEHLWLTTLAKVAIDQPNYVTYRRLVADQKGES
ncbi:hypothetical protein D9M68_428250 [compost metagenome]|uniref:DUF6285 domain-containing protein n=1 Tax=Pseudomonas jinjuensis TaxID=198616 RepID=A0A1H0HJX6_9PSED|nr:DUF6285 domain-containing protein [Pseudomonas jinjuensis]SDO19482.1 hypothetical protein SAMN05216193_108268 [Pseudomonas jinjuensis]